MPRPAAAVRGGGPRRAAPLPARPPGAWAASCAPVASPRRAPAGPQYLARRMRAASEEVVAEPSPRRARGDIALADPARRLPRPAADARAVAAHLRRPCRACCRAAPSRCRRRLGRRDLLSPARRPVRERGRGRRALRGAARARADLHHGGEPLMARAAILGLAGPSWRRGSAPSCATPTPGASILFARNVATPEQLGAGGRSPRRRSGARRPGADRPGGRARRPAAPPHWRGWPRGGGRRGGGRRRCACAIG